MLKKKDRRPFVVCLRAEVQSEFTDNEFGYCARCSCKVQHRPDVPTPNRLLCVPCLYDIQAESGGAVEIVVTAQTMRDIYLQRSRN